MDKQMWSTIKRKYNRQYKYVLWMMPSIIALIVLIIYPRLQIFPMSLYKWNPISNVKEFRGLYYFKLLFKYSWDDTVRYFGNTALYVLFLLVIQTILSFALALALRKNTRHNRFFRVIFFLPMVFSSTMVSLTWLYMYDANLGVINNLLGGLGISGFPGFSFFRRNWMALLVIVIVHIWANMGYPLTILTSGMNTISDDYLEAAKIDGANDLQSFWKITFPLMLPTILRLTLMTITTGAMANDYIIMMGSRNDSRDFDTLSAYVYKSISTATDYGPICARSVILFLILAVLTIAQFVAMRKIEDRVLG